MSSRLPVPIRQRKPDAVPAGSRVTADRWPSALLAYGKLADRPIPMRSQGMMRGSRRHPGHDRRIHAATADKPARNDCRYVSASIMRRMPAIECRRSSSLTLTPIRRARSGAAWMEPGSRSASADTFRCLHWRSELPIHDRSHAHARTASVSRCPCLSGDRSARPLSHQNIDHLSMPAARDCSPIGARLAAQ